MMAKVSLWILGYHSSIDMVAGINGLGRDNNELKWIRVSHKELGFLIQSLARVRQWLRRNIPKAHGLMSQMAEH